MQTTTNSPREKITYSDARRDTIVQLQDVFTKFKQEQKKHPHALSKTHHNDRGEVVEHFHPGRFFFLSFVCCFMQEH